MNLIKFINPQTLNVWMCGVHYCCSEKQKLIEGGRIPAFISDISGKKFIFILICKYHS